MRILSILSKIIAGILILLFVIILFIRSPWGQNIIKEQVVSYVSSKTHATITLNKLYITFTGDITVEGLYVEDLNKDTLLYSRSLTADIPLWPILTGGGIIIDKLDWTGVRANVHRENEEMGFNYQFLLDAFMSADSNEVVVNAPESSSVNLSVGEVNLSDIIVDFDDQVGGISAMMNLGAFTIAMDQTNIGEMRFEVGSAKLKDSHVTYVQTKPFPESIDTSESALPFLVLNNFQINNFSGLYQSDPDGIKAEFDVKDLKLHAPEVDLADNVINISNFRLRQSMVNVHLNSEGELEVVEIQPSIEPGSRNGFTWPDWEVTLDEIILTDNEITYRVNNSLPVTGQFNPDAVVLNDFTLKADDLYLRNQSAGARLREFHFKEESGLAVDKFQFLLKMDNENFSLSDLKVDALNSHLSGKITAQYASVEALINDPDKTMVDLDLSNIAVDINDLYRFQPNLRHNHYVRILATRSITGNLKASGQLSSLKIPDAGIRWGSQTAIFASGRLYHPTDPKRLGFDFSKVLIKSTRADMNRFMSEDSVGIRYPEQARITAKLAGNLEDITGEVLLETTLGSINLQGNYADRDSLAFLVDLQINNLQLDTLLQNPQLGNLYLTARANGEGADINSLDAAVQATVDSFSYNDYPIVNWQLAGNIDDGKGMVESAYRDSNLNIKLNAYVVMDSVAPEVDASVHLIGADLAALSVMDKKVKMAFRLDADFKGNGSSFNASANLKEGIVVYEEKSYPLGMMNMTAYVTPDTTSASIKSRMLDLTLRSNTSPAGFSTAIIRHIESYLTDSLTTTDSLIMPAHVLVEASLKEDPLLSGVFFPGLEEMDTMKLKFDFDEAEKNLMGKIEIPYLKYSGIEIDSVGMSAFSDEDHFHMEMGLREIIAGPLTINRTRLINEVRNQTLYSNFQATYQNKELVHFNTEISKRDDSIRIHIDPEVLVFDAKDWEIPDFNQILIGENKIQFENFRIHSGQQKLTINDNPGKTDLIIDFQRFNISNLISYFNPDSLLASGSLDGKITLKEPLGNAALVANLKIDSLHVLDVDMGTMTLNGETEDAKNYSFNLSLQGGEVDLSTTAEYHVTENASNVLLDMSIDRINMKAVESFSMGEIENSSGFLSGHVKAEGSLSNLIYDGQLVFNNASLTPSILQTPFILGEQQIQFDNDGIKLNNFSISDKDGNSFTISGDILTGNLFNPSFDLKMTANNFQVLNASEEKNSLFYGKASFDAKATLTGDLSLPVLDLQLEIGSGTDVTYIMPHGQANLNKRDGIVEFVNKVEPDNILSREEEKSVVIKGYDIDAVVSVNKDASFTVIISKETGDDFKISGEGDLNFSIDPNGITTLTGIYTLQDGHYEMNLYNLVNRRFDIAKGSTVSWSGDPFDAKLDVRAIYRIETTPVSLMASQTSGADPSVKNQYRRKIPFLVYLNVDGQLSEPKLSFSLDMPEESRGDLGGQVYGRIQQVNQEDEVLNKQVFSLLVLGRFYPDSGSDGSSGGIVNVARDNLNQALSDQLNLFSDKLLGDTGLELDFGLDSYTDYQGQNPQNRTELDIAAQKKFLEDRLIVKVGSEVDIEGGNSNPGEENPLIGNVSVEYLLTENGQFRIRAFRKNVYENVIDGQTIVSGLALLFTREFNKFNELWKPMVARRKLNAAEESKEK